jgi:alpha-L-rhamnosidase
MIENGASTIWERWDSWVPERESLWRRKSTLLQLPQTPGFQTNSMNSFNHQEFASVGEWIYRVILGIEPDETRPGYKHFFIRPRPGGSLTYARGSLDSVRGKIAVDWRRTGDTLTLEVTVPPNTTSTVILPEAFRAGVRLDGKPVDAHRFELASGSYRIESGK